MKTSNIFFKKFFCIIIITTLMCTCLTGCKNIVEINDLGIILAIGIDITDDENYIVSLQILNIDSQVNNNSISSTVYTSTGETIVNALDNIEKKLGKELNYAHIQYMVIGDTLSKQGIYPVLDFSLRFSEIRSNVPIFITRTNIVDILNAKISTNVISAFSVRDLINIEKSKGYTVVTTFVDYINKSYKGSTISIIGELELNQGNEKNYKLSGAAVFKDNKLYNYLSPTETKSLNWINGKIYSGNMIIQYPNQNKISLNILSSSSNISTKINNGKINIKVNIKVKSNINEMPSNLNPNANPELMNIIAIKENEVIYNELELVVNKFQKELGEDIFNFGNTIFEMHPAEWKKLSKNWGNEFKKANIDINVFSEIKQTGSISKSPK